MAGHALRILIVEDQFLIAKQLETIAAQAGHGIVGLAANGQQACDLALSTAPDVVFVDISLGKGLRGA
jgi:response regulator NasT